MQQLSINKFAATSMTGDEEKVTSGPKFLSVTSLTTSAKGVPLNTACAL